MISSSSKTAWTRAVPETPLSRQSEQSSGHSPTNGGATRSGQRDSRQTKSAGGDKAYMVLDANEAAASIGYRLSEVIAIYPITPSSPMGEFADEWAAKSKPNIWGAVPSITEMQSEGGAAGAVHGAIQAGALATTFTASQGLLLMIPNMYKIAGELTPFVLHVAARTLATHALSIFGDQSDVMACRQTGFAMLCSTSVQEAHDMALIAHAASLKSRVPFMHFFDGFRTSHEVARAIRLSDDDLRYMIDEEMIKAHRERALTPDRPVIRGTAQNPDTFFQSREAANSFYNATPDIVQTMMDRFAERTGRQYRLFEYDGHPEAERVIVIMGSGAQTVRRTVEALVAKGEKVGVLNARLYRPFDAKRLLAAMPKSVARVAVLDRTKEPGALGEPLFLDVMASFCEGWYGTMPLMSNGRYGLSSKEFTPRMVQAVFTDLAADCPKSRFTVGIVDDVTHLSLPMPETAVDVLSGDTHQALFFGLGSDGTVGANKNTIKIVGDETDLNVQAYFVYDSKKSGSLTVSHLRFGSGNMDHPYLIEEADFVSCGQWEFVDQVDMLSRIKKGGKLLINSPFSPEETWNKLPQEMAQQIIDKQVEVYVIDAYKVAHDAGLGRRINTVMQTAFFGLAKVIDSDKAINNIKKAIEYSYGKKGGDIVSQNIAAVNNALSLLKKMTVPATVGGHHRRPPVVSPKAPDFVQRVTAAMLANKGDQLPVSAFPVDGTWPVGTTQWEKRNIALEIPVWDSALCIQCNKCVMSCPHAAIRAKVYDQSALKGAPEGFKTTLYKSEPFKGKQFTVQVAPEDCTGCSLCIEVCPSKDKKDPKRKAINMSLQLPLRDAERERYAFFLDIPEVDRKLVKPDIKSVGLLKPLFEYSGACQGCGETSYIKLMTQLYGDRALIANATGCSSIYSGNLPTTPYTTNADGRGPAWANSLFEDNAEFGLGLRLSVDAHQDHATMLLKRLGDAIGSQLVDELLGAKQDDEAGIEAQRARVVALKQKLAKMDKSTDVSHLTQLADYLVRKSVWIIGGDGWAYDIGYGGLDHVLASTRDVNILVLDTEVYSNTGGQASKSTPVGASAKFAVTGKATPKKDLGMLAMSYGHAYVARVSFGAKDTATLRAFIDADAHKGPSLIIAYSHCISHGYDLSKGFKQQKAAVDSGACPLFRFDPKRIAAGENPLTLDSGPAKNSLKDYMLSETRFRVVEKTNPERFAMLLEMAERHAKRRQDMYEQMAQTATCAPGDKAAAKNTDNE
jgi:pyruvate-ferredoxin/flavodoxin oxidoreductase